MYSLLHIVFMTIITVIFIAVVVGQVEETMQIKEKRRKKKGEW